MLYCEAMAHESFEDELTRVFGAPRTVLEVGCGRAARAKVGKDLGARVTGIEDQRDLAGIARDVVDELIEADPDSDAATNALQGKLFDLIVFRDALSRAKDPRRLIERYAASLEDGGRILIIASDLAARAAGHYAMEASGLEFLFSGSSMRILARKRPSWRKLSLTVGMISMNEAAAVGRVIQEIRAHAPSAEVLLVDSSKDETPKIAEANGARVIRQFPPKGYGPAMMRLLRETTSDVIITMDCDGTYPADRILQLHSLIEEGADLVNATRTRSRPKTMPYPNFIANRVFASAARVLHGVPTTDVHSGMRAYRTSMLRGIHIEEDGAALPVSLLMIPARMGYRIVEVQIPYFERIGETTLHRFDSTRWTFKRLLQASSLGNRALSERTTIL
jgi:SAM-dependent methyltransferase